MKAFDLEKALAGEPVKLRNGIKAYIKFDLHKEAIISYNPLYQLNGYTVDKDNNFLYIENWLGNGNFHADGRISNYDIVGMWEEPRPRVQLDLPYPLKEWQPDCYYVDYNWEIKKTNHKQKNIFTEFNSVFGLYFASEKDAQEWIDAMKNNRR